MRTLFLAAAGVAMALPACAQSLRDAVDAAWALQPAARAREARVSEYAARRSAANAFAAGPPEVAFGHKTDQPHRNEGLREWEAEVALPLWLPGQRERRTAVVDAERSQFEDAIGAAKLRIAGEVREAHWRARLAESEAAVARRKASQAAALAADVDRRVKAGDLAPVDLYRAQAAAQSALSAVADAEAGVFRARRSFAALTGMAAVSGGEQSARGSDALDAHPELRALQRAIETAQARLTEARLDRRDNPEVALAMVRERGAFDVAYDNAVAFRFRLPLASEARNRPRIERANADLIERQAAYELERNRRSAEVDVARRELEQAEAVRRLAESRFGLLAETQRLLARAFDLGELDFVSRLRAENERFDAELARERAVSEVSRAVSRLNQALGLMP